ncbi:MAG: hypothetical protein ACYC9R_12685, partial [Nitrosotalea sp.]
ATADIAQGMAGKSKYPTALDASMGNGSAASTAPASAGATGSWEAGPVKSSDVGLAKGVPAIEGQVYKNAQGKFARLVNGKWVPVTQQ